MKILEEKYRQILEERIKTSSSKQSKAAYEIALLKFNELFKK